MNFEDTVTHHQRLHQKNGSPHGASHDVSL